MIYINASCDLRALLYARVVVFPTAPAFRDQGLSSGILQEPGIFHLLGTYYSIQS